mgnify:CR=1 FL=1
MVKHWPKLIPDQEPSSEIYHHDELMKMIDGFDPERGLKFILKYIKNFEKN